MMIYDHNRNNHLYTKQLGSKYEIESNKINHLYKNHYSNKLQENRLLKILLISLFSSFLLNLVIKVFQILSVSFCFSKIINQIKPHFSLDLNSQKYTLILEAN